MIQNKQNIVMQHGVLHSTVLEKKNVKVSHLSKKCSEMELNIGYNLYDFYQRTKDEDTFHVH